MPTAYLTHPACRGHQMGAHHPEAPERLDAINDRLIAEGLMDLVRPYDAPQASREQITRVHTPAYFDAITARAPRQGQVMLDPDTWMGPGSLEAALRAAGAVVAATDRVIGGEAGNAFCAVRPPGHHAEAARAMGFCIFNNIAVGVAHALETHGLERVAVVDFDVHHGNGTEALFRDDPRVLLCSSFQHPYYPHTPLSRGRPNLVHMPLAAGAGSAEFRAAWSGKGLPAVEAFAPQMIFVSAGFDAHIADDLASLELVEADFGWITAEVCATAARHAGGRVVSALEGGYVLDALGASVVAHVKALLES